MQFDDNVFYNILSFVDNKYNVSCVSKHISNLVYKHFCPKSERFLRKMARSRNFEAMKKIANDVDQRQREMMFEESITFDCYKNACYLALTTRNSRTILLKNSFQHGKEMMEKYLLRFVGLKDIFTGVIMYDVVINTLTCLRSFYDVFSDCTE